MRTPAERLKEIEDIFEDVHSGGLDEADCDSLYLAAIANGVAGLLALALAGPGSITVKGR